MHPHFVNRVVSLKNLVKMAWRKRRNMCFVSFQSIEGCKSMQQTAEGVEACFSGMKDPQINRKKLYSLIEILFVVLCGITCGTESWRDFVLFEKGKIDFLRKYFAFAHGIPSINNFARLFIALELKAFKACFRAWIKSLQTLLSEVIAIDGKTLCKSRAWESQIILRKRMPAKIWFWLIIS